MRLRFGQAAVRIMLVAQIAWIFADQFYQTRYGSWGALQALNLYEIRVHVGGRTLSQEEACARYHLDTCGLNSRSASQLFKAVKQFETTYGRKDGADVEVDYRVNGGPVQNWRLEREAP